MSLFQFFEEYGDGISAFIKANETHGRWIEFPTITQGNYTCFKFTKSQFESFLEIKNSPLYQALL